MRAFPWPDLDIIFTDPPWKEMQLYRSLAQLAKNKLKPGGLLLTIAGSLFIPEVANILINSGLHYIDTLCFVYSRASTALAGKPIKKVWKPVLLFSKGKPRLDPLGGDWSNAITVYSQRHESKQGHDWQQPYWPVYYWLSKVVQPGDTIADPFAGYGTTVPAAKSIGRLRCIATDLDQAAVFRARDRLSRECPKEGVGFLSKYESERKARM
jgi:DNA modification methylase